MKNKVDELIKKIGVTPYSFAKETGISKNTVYLLKNNPLQFPSKEVFSRVIKTYGVTPNDIVEWTPDTDETDIASISVSK